MRRYHDFAMLGAALPPQAAAGPEDVPRLEDLLAMLAAERAHSAGLSARAALAESALPAGSAPTLPTGRILSDFGRPQVALDVAYEEAYAARLASLGMGGAYRPPRLA